MPSEHTLREINPFIVMQTSSSQQADQKSFGSSIQKRRLNESDQNFSLLKESLLTKEPLLAQFNDIELNEGPLRNMHQPTQMTGTSQSILLREGYLQSCPSQTVTTSGTPRMRSTTFYANHNSKDRSNHNFLQAQETLAKQSPERS